METNSVDYICAVLRKLGMIEVRIEFSGSGDSGNIDSLTWKGMCELEKTSVDTFPEVKWRDAAGAVVETPEQLLARVAEAIAATGARVSAGRASTAPTARAAGGAAAGVDPERGEPHYSVAVQPGGGGGG